MLRHVFKEEQLLIVQMNVLKAPQTDYERAFYAKNKDSPSAHAWLIRVGMRLGNDIRHAVCSHWGERWLGGALWRVMTHPQGLCFKTTAPIGIGVVVIYQTTRTKSSAITRLEIDFSQQWNAQEHSERLLTTLLINGNVTTEPAGPWGGCTTTKELLITHQQKKRRRKKADRDFVSTKVAVACSA